MGVIPVITYFSIIVFLLSVIIRYTKISKMPLHLRWELYPVAHEKGKADYGGSYLEELNWWKKERESSLIGELKVMLPEILLLAGVWEKNKSQWLRSFPFHFGLYLLIGTLFLLLVGGIMVATGAEVSAEAGAIGALLYHVTPVLGYVGLGLALIGSLALLGRRLLNADYREYTTRENFFGLFFFVVALGVALTAHLKGDADFAQVRAYFGQLVTFDFTSGATEMSALTATEIALASLLIAYIPLTHMSHFFTKWFTYHHIRWSDEPNFPNSKIEKAIQKNLSYPVSWSASHIRGDGKKNWVDVATSDVEETKE